MPEIHFLPVADSIIRSQGMVFAKPNRSVLEQAIAWADVVHFMMPFALSRVGLRIAKEMGKPVTAAFHVQPENITSTIHLGKNKKANELLYEWFRDDFYNEFTHIHCPSPFIAGQLKEHGYQAKLHIISNGVSDEFYPRVRQKEPELAHKFVILMIGRYSEEKRQDVLIEAVKRSAHSHRIQLILAGQVKPAQAALAAELDLKLVDYFRREELTVANAAATAEGTVQVILERLERSLLGSRCLVLGFGRIGKLLCHRLTAMGAHVTAAARRPESLAWVRAYGYETADIGRLEGNLGAFDVVVNTVPEPVFGADRLRELKPDCLCVDVASVQGVDLNAAEALRLECIWARGLPGKLMPKTAGAVIRDTVYTIIKEQGVIL